MENKKILKSAGIALTALLTSSIAFANPSSRDSIGVENQNGKKVILHKLENRESYYSLGRKYRVDVKQIIDFNANKALKAGEVVKIPTGMAFSESPNTATSQASTDMVGTEYTEYKVGSKETLFSISKKFGVRVEAIKQANQLSSDGLQAGQLIRIPGKTTSIEQAEQEVANNTKVISNEELNKTTSDSSTQTAPAQSAQQIIEPAKKEIPKPDSTPADSTPTDNTPANRYGIRQVTANGIGIWMDDLNGQTGKMLALHNTAPVGTVIKITNPMTNRTTYAKVVGKFNETSENKDAIIVVSKSVASLIGVIDRRFQVNISY